MFFGFSNFYFHVRRRSLNKIQGFFFLWVSAFFKISSDIMTFKAFHQGLTEMPERLQFLDLSKLMSYTCMPADLKPGLIAIGLQYIHKR